MTNIEKHLANLEALLHEKQEARRTFPTTLIGRLLDLPLWKEARIALIISILDLVLLIAAFLLLMRLFLH